MLSSPGMQGHGQQRRLRPDLRLPALRPPANLHPRQGGCCAAAGYACACRCVPVADIWQVAAVAALSTGSQATAVLLHDRMLQPEHSCLARLAAVAHMQRAAQRTAKGDAGGL
ncbi:hypothetical protein ABPG77_005601 [Micractinium sp. CCAP 211/92]